MRLAVAKDELDHMLGQDSVASRPVPVLFFANKMDLEGAMEPVECMAGLGLQGITEKPWHIQASNARTGAGLTEGIRWLTTQAERYLRVKRSPAAASGSSVGGGVSRGGAAAGGAASASASGTG